MTVEEKIDNLEQEVNVRIAALFSALGELNYKIEELRGDIAQLSSSQAYMGCDDIILDEDE